MAVWIRNAGNLEWAGDSTVVGFNDLLGGYRAPVQAALTAENIRFDTVGPTTDAYGKHWGVSGENAYTLAPLVRANAALYRPRFMYFAAGINDIGGHSRTAAQTRTALQDCVAEAQAGYSGVICLVQTIIVPQNASFPTYWANRAIAEETNTLLPAMCASVGAHLVDVGAPPCPDGVHPSQASYTDVMAPIIAAAFLRVIPGG